MNRRRSALTFLLQMTCSMFVAANLYSGEVILRWDPNTEPDLAGYALFYGRGSGNYQEMIDIGNRIKYTVEGLQGGSTYYFALRAYDELGNKSDYSDEISYEVEQEYKMGSAKSALSGMDTALPKRLALRQNYPNPFNPTTTIAFDIPGTAGVKEHASLAIYDLHGRRVRKLIDTELAPGSYRIVWDGRTEKGERIPSGMFLCRLNFGGRSLTKKITAVK